MGTGAVGVPLREIALVIVVATAVTFLTTGIIRHIMVRWGKLAAIRDRDVHTVPKPRLGGVAMFSGFLCSVYLAGLLPALTRGFRPVTPEMDAVVWAGFVIVIVGVLDDLFELDAVTKLIGQLAGAVVMSLLGLSWTLLYMPFDGGSTVFLDQVQSTILTTLFTVMLINAINFVDGLDGLAAGLGMIAALAILAFSLTVLYDQGGTVAAYPPAIIAAALFGMCAGFLPHNFEPSRIFMGDSGSMLIGLLLAAAATSASGKINMTLYGPADIVATLSPFIVVIAAVFIPTLDLVLAVIRRVSKGQSPFTADKMHLHHRLLALGHSHRHVVLVLYAWVTVVAFGAVGFTVFPARVALGGIAIGIVLAIAWTLIPLRRSRWGRVAAYDK
ncbi:undecaprenyl/decaprenyl-phosphate alpha-N-acetylglucosaminyl 1-phosphate transferase [Corynebacterium hindlerae]|uniref:Undecaprenyl/decaprenyl-phosphate alpha-N-acetylglucosaminyl 1-phosphate transferase n=1 Tax=Corynebacterium hindlerae TaxID=699041 RepID=A0A7G5FEP0_9CORY|nr:MraY family glycosyltransferase [Corynebacterium hindlerae]QMV85081.1 undecaprenyl/decaprenyl-phosphate alpha-N-acetylglucosaminyl 1-phosphate transferase [Corynebacterium hindlerae]QTH59024.1 undecaprenyl/decaprenyl-phosphate alpha-N-acetylglucosaminyl 1-phosphate transferase [Corynebacterium hindlerae]